ncbi:helix-turn-helix domain-containing protein [Chryseolinea lacunae]|uniref:Helix-turn-helix domain-containing protein n=1 Tax=Chryseolinea lacunae TaxID=2801331 RepID=A0ABS1KPY5_9BACT|nr:helix-turn-helix transcriptional regulator [Chryseolinea lacunae]MBL0741368.1 helix-turn-helix domain-containing protein [Chryseolinea lacunae]
MKEYEFSEKASRPHQGRNVRRFRDMARLKQEALAAALGGDWTQKKVSQIEAMEEIEPALLEQLAKALHVTPAAIEHFDEEKTLAFISNIFNDHSGPGISYSTVTYENANDALLAENKKLYETLLKEKDALLKEKDERIALLQKLLEDRAAK